MSAIRSVSKGFRELPRSLRRATALICALGWSVGCATNPNFTPPAAPRTAGFLDPTAPRSTSAMADGAQRPVEGAPLDSRWWQAFGSAKLDAAIEEGLRANPTLEAAEAALRQARHRYDAQAGSTEYPQANATLSGGRKSVNNAAMGQTGGENTFNLYGASVHVGYDFDLFRGNRRALEALAARADYRRFQLENARLTNVLIII